MFAEPVWDWPMDASSVDPKLELLKRVPLFAGLAAKQLSTIAVIAEEPPRSPGWRSTIRLQARILAGGAQAPAEARHAHLIPLLGEVTR